MTGRGKAGRKSNSNKEEEGEEGGWKCEQRGIQVKGQP